jgi:hypothetical protein
LKFSDDGSILLNLLFKSRGVCGWWIFVKDNQRRYDSDQGNNNPDVGGFHTNNLRNLTVIRVWAS